GVQPRRARRMEHRPHGERATPDGSEVRDCESIARAVRRTRNRAVAMGNIHRRRLCRQMRDVTAPLIAATLDRMSFGAPAQHAASEIRDITEPGLLQHDGRLRRARTRSAHGNDRTVACELAGAPRKLAERDPFRGRNSAERTVKLLSLTHVDDLYRVGALFERVRLDFENPRE